MIQVFISHNSTDAAEGRRLRAGLVGKRPDHLVVFLSSEHGQGPLGGTSWRSWIQRTMRSCDVVIFLAGRQALSPWCSAELGMARLLDKPIIPLGIDSRAPVNPVIDGIHVAPLDQPIDAILSLIDEQVLDPLEGLVGPGAGIVPYPGLVQLDENQEVLLSGRQEERDLLLGTFDRISPNEPRLVVVSGPSGSGKSSLIRAGVVPRLRADDWSITGPTQPSQLAEGGFPDHGPRGRSVVIVDQAEELVLQGAKTRRQIEEWLIECISSDTSVLLIIRVEFRDELGGTLDAIAQASIEPGERGSRKPVDHYIPFLGAAELYEVVRRPARLVQLGLGEDLVDRLVRETGTGAALPLLAYTLHELWEGRDRERVELREASLDQLNGVTGVLNTRATEALNNATEGDPDLVEPVLAVLSRLASPAQNPPTRSPLRVETLSAEQRAWIDEFSSVGLVTYRTSYALDDRIGVGIRPRGQDLVDVTHEALFAWDPLARTIELERERNLDRTAIQSLASQWHAGAKSDATLLLAGDRLEFAIDEGMGDGDGDLGEFVRASRRHDRERRLRRFLIGASVLALIVAVAAAVVAIAQWASASRERDRAQQAEVQAESVRVAAQANQAIASERDLALLAAVAAYRIDPNVDTEGALFNTLSTPTGPLRYFSDDAAEWATLRLLDESTGLVVDRNLQPATVDLTTRELDVIPVPGIEVAEARPGIAQRWAAIRGRRPPSTWFVGLVEPGSGAVSLLEHPVEVTVAVPTRTGVAFGDVDGAIFAADLIEGSLTETTFVDRHGAEITELALSPEGERLASASPSGIKVHRRHDGGWSVGSEILGITPGTRTAETVLFRRDAPAELYAAGSDPTIRRWTISEGTPLESDPVGSHRGTVEAMAIDPETPLLYTGGLEGSIQVWQAAAGAPVSELLAHRQDVLALSTVGLGTLVSTDTDTAILWDLASDRIVERPRIVPDEWSEERFRALVMGDGPLAAITVDDRLLVADGTTRAVPAGARKAWWTADGDLVVETGDAAQVDLAPSSLWLVGAGEPEELGSGLDAADVGRCIAAVAEGPTVRFIDVGGCEPAPRSIVLDRGGVKEMALSSGGDRLLVVHDNNRIEEHLVEDGSPGRTVGGLHGITATSARWLTDDEVIIGYDRGGAVAVVDLDQAEPGAGIVPVGDHDDAVWWLAVDHERGRLFTGGQDGLIGHTDLSGPSRVGNPLIGAQRRRENDLTAMVRGLRLVDDGRALVAIHGARIAAWELEPAALVERICSDVERTLATAETLRLGLADEDQPCR